MAYTEKFSVPALNDPELQLRVRDEIEYYVTFPEGYKNDKAYGLVFCIPGFGDIAASEYQCMKLRPYIADQYDYITVGVRYHNDERNLKSNISFNFPGICNLYNLPANYFAFIRTGEEALNALFDILIARNIKSLDPRVSVQTAPHHRYSSFGFMPAIEHFAVLGNVFKKFRIDKRNIIAFGSSYGGYISSLLAKYAPQTFSMIIDNSGYVVASLQEVIGGTDGNVGGSIYRVIDNVRYELTCKPQTMWSLDEMSPYYFSDSHRHIRNLLVEQHQRRSPTLHCLYHSSQDRLVPVLQKNSLANLLRQYHEVHYREVNASHIDGQLFKNLDHGMNASLRGIFDISMIEYGKRQTEKDNATDLDKRTYYHFSCLGKDYSFLYSGEGVEVKITPARN